ncbi:MAG: hypothetical protein IT179_11315 [Acidobacteria bacterium]|nr:hypothetical protein [Acidobacteriota bacterium]
MQVSSSTDGFGSPAAEHAGLVVTGLREPGHGLPGEIAETVLEAKNAIVLAVPSGAWQAGISEPLNHPIHRGPLDGEPLSQSAQW